jgi:hypothetical protein
VLFPRRAGKPKAGDSPAEELAAAQQLRGPLLPAAKAAPALEKVAVTEEMKVRWVSAGGPVLDVPQCYCIPLGLLSKNLAVIHSTRDWR